MKIDYYAYRSGIKNWNSQLKVLVAVITLCLVIVLNNIAVSLFVILSMGILTLVIGKTPFKVYLHLMTIPLTFIILSTITIALQFARCPVGKWCVSAHFFYIYVTKSSIMIAVNVFFKSMAGMSALYMMSLSTPVNEFIIVLQKMHLPKILAELMNLIYRYIFILFEVANQMQIAAKARLGYQTFFRSCKSFAGIAGNLFLISLKKAGAYYDALLSRGYNGTLEFLTEEHPVKVWQIIGSMLYFMLLVIIAVIG